MRLIICVATHTYSHLETLFDAYKYLSENYPYPELITFGIYKILHKLFTISITREHKYI